jgi:hypothetical protein
LFGLEILASINIIDVSLPKVCLSSSSFVSVSLEKKFSLVT